MVAPLLLLWMACADPWDLPGKGNVDLDGPFWDPALIAATDGAYVRLPATRTLVRVRPSGDYDVVDLQGATPDRLAVSPDGRVVLAWISWTTCADQDEKIQRVDDCDEDDLGTEYRLALIEDAKVQAEWEVPPQFTRLEFNAAADVAALWLDPTVQDVEVDGILNLTEVLFLDLSGGDPVAAPVGFAASDVLFTEGSNPRAVVLSQSQVAVVDLADFRVTVTYPLTLDSGQDLQPSDVALTPDGRYALVSVTGSSDLYVLDLEQEYIDIVELDGVPADLAVDASLDRTLIVYGNAATADVLEHDYFEVVSVDLAEPARHIEGGDGMAVLWNDATSVKDVYRLEIETGDLIRYRAENPLLDLWVTADHAWALATLNAEGGGDFYDSHYGLAVFDLNDDDDPVTLAVSGYPLGVELVETGSPTALVLVDGNEALYRLDLATASAESLALDEPPVGIDALPDGTFVVAQDAALGLLTFLDPQTGEPTARAAGFAATNLYADRGRLVRRGEEE